MTKHAATFDGGPIHGQTRVLEADVTAEDPRDKADPPLVLKVAAAREGELRMEMYLRHKDKQNGLWRYAHVPPENP